MICSRNQTHALLLSILRFIIETKVSIQNFSMSRRNLFSISAMVLPYVLGFPRTWSATGCCICTSSAPQSSSLSPAVVNAICHMYICRRLLLRVTIGGKVGERRDDQLTTDPGAQTEWPGEGACRRQAS